MFINFKKQFYKSQEGTLVLLALLIMSGILVTASIISTLVTRELRFTKDIENSIMSFYASETGAEDALYKLRIEDASAFDLNAKTGELSNTATWSRDAWNSTKHFQRDILAKDHTLEVYFFDDEDINRAAGVSAVRIAWKSGASMEVIRKKWDHSQKLFVEETSFVYLCGVGTECAEQVMGGLNPGFAYSFIIKAVNDDINGLSIKAFASPFPLPAFEGDIFIPIPLTFHSVGFFGTSQQAIDITIDRVKPWDYE